MKKRSKLSQDGTMGTLAMTVIRWKDTVWKAVKTVLRTGFLI